MMRSFFHRHLRIAAAVSAIALLVSGSAQSAEAQRQRTGVQSTVLAPVGAAPALVVSPMTWDEQNIRMGWTVAGSPTAIIIARSVAGSPWRDIATVTKGQHFTDVGAAKMVPCNGTIHYRATAIYGSASGAPTGPAIAGVATAPSPTPGVSAAVAWQREMPLAVKNLTANSPGPGQVNLAWEDAARVHVFRDGVRITSIPVSGFSVGEHGVKPLTNKNPSTMHEYHVAPVCEVTGTGWVMAPIELEKNVSVFVNVQ